MTGEGAKLKCHPSYPLLTLACGVGQQQTLRVTPQHVAPSQVTFDIMLSKKLHKICK